MAPNPKIQSMILTLIYLNNIKENSFYDSKSTHPLEDQSHINYFIQYIVIFFIEFNTCSG